MCYCLWGYVHFPFNTIKMYEVEFRERLIESMPNLRHYAYKFTCAGDEVDELYIPFNMHVSGVAYKSIADRLGLPIGTVKSRIHIARKRLKVMLRSCLNFIGK